MRNTLYKLAGGLAILIFIVKETHAQGLYLSSGAQLVISGAPQLVLNDAGLTNDGQIWTDSSNFLLIGNMPFIGGRRPVAFYDLVIGTDAQLNNHASVAGHIFMQGGNLQLNQYTLDLGSTGSITGERNDAHISGGLIRAYALLNAPYETNPGNIGIAFTSDANLGWTTVLRGHEQQTDAGIQRWFDISPENNSTLPVSLRLYYLENELAGKSRTSLALFAKDGGLNPWTSWGRDQADPAAGWVAKKTIGGPNRFTLGIPDRKANALQVFPNPSPGSFRTSLLSEQEGDRLMELYDGGGHLLETRKLHCRVGMNFINWNETGLAQGIYHLYVEGWLPVIIVIAR